ncbi:DUF3047 domain-containing protein [Palleronia abyssalis]|uniref:DUF3047 domain-containing protein n=1 Tax=Palleronia abyssalis TaxID=1501240 RepID=A0A2R8BTH5_9RHOB|nr:DUF3047 domain-containing protein [Palleronia abyssalis]SPJ23435.1 hypothetical protein PAA8504_01246 [Palleronia abyssalis]
MTRTLPLASLLTALSLPAFAAEVAFDDQWQTQKFPFQADNEYGLGGDTLTVASDDSVSLVYRRTPDLAGSETASWTWDVLEGVPATDLSVKGGDDRNLALYFVFSDPDTATELEDASLRSLLNEDDVRILVYVRGGQSAPGTVLDSPYLGERGKTIVLSGTGTGAEEVDVNLTEDLQDAFGTRPSELLGIAVSSDSDDTDSTVDATISGLTLK